MSARTPPRNAIRLLEWLLPGKDRDAILGDLAEEFAFRARASTRASAARWYWGQVARSIPLMLWSERRRGRWFGTLGVAIVAYIAASVLEAVGTSLVLELFRPDPRLATVLSVIVGLVTMVLGGYVAAFRQGAAPILAGIIFIVVVVLFMTVTDSAPLWYGLTFLIAGPVAAVAGGRLNLMRRDHRAT